MDPVTLIGILGSVVSIGDVVGRSIKRLTDLKNAYRNIPMVAATLIGQLHVVKTALNQLSSLWNSESFKRHPRYRQLAMQMGTALESFNPLMLSLETRLNSVDADKNLVTAKAKLSFLWNEREMNDFLTLVDRQVNALNLLLQAIQCTWAQQQQIIDEVESQDILQLARDCSSSIIGVSDRESIMTEGTDGMSAEFEFDALILGCQPYLSAHRSHLRQAIRAARSPLPSTSPETGELETTMTNDDREKYLTDSFDTLTIRSLDAVTIQETNLPFSGVHNQAIDEAFLNRQNFNIIEKLVLTLHELAPVIELPTSPQRSPSLNKKTLRNLFNAKRPRPLPGQQSSGIEKPSNTVNLMLMGTSESGKTTLLRGFELLADGDFTVYKRITVHETIFDNVVQGIRAVLEVMDQYKLSLGDDTNQCHASTIWMQPPTMNVEHLPTEVTKAIKALWTDEGFWKCLSQRRECQLFDSLEYYVNCIERWERKDFIANVEDVLRARHRTTAVTQKDFSFRNLTLRVYDVGGMRPFRKKWIHCFDSIDLVIFTVDAAAYNRCLWEDHTVYRMDEQLTLFEGVVNSAWLVKKKFLVVFSKVDLLEQRVWDCHPALYLPDLKPGVAERNPTVDEYLRYLEDRFLSLVEPADRRQEITIAHANLVDPDTYGPVAQEIIRAL